jgi:ABC-type Fe3+/spermidine/putrescine transport system ATPase subunit
MPHLALQGISKRFGAGMAVAGMDLEVERGAFVAMLGPSGCGKTTTLRMVAGFLEPSAGRILLGGRDITTAPVWARNFGFVFQNYALFPHLTAGDNVAFGLKAAVSAGRSATGGWPRRSTWSASARSRPATRPSSPAGSSSAWRWPARW